MWLLRDYARHGWAWLRMKEAQARSTQRGWRASGWLWVGATAETLGDRAQRHAIQRAQDLLGWHPVAPGVEVYDAEQAPDASPPHETRRTPPR